MDDVQRLHLRMQCLELATQMCKMTADSYGVVSKAEEYWKWLSPDLEVVKKPDDDIPF